MKFLLSGLKAILIVLLLLVVIAVVCNFWVEQSTSQQIYEDIDLLPHNTVGLVLGTSKYTVRGYQNPYFANRINAAVRLYEAGKVKHLLVSGDNSLKEYNEPRQMLNALIEKGIPASAITMDFAGFRTLDSVVRSKAVFGQNELTIISQKFHNQRALFLANHKDVEAIGYNAKGVPLSYGIKVRLREYFARCKAVVDIVLGTQPKFLGKKEPILIKGVKTEVLH